MEQHAGEDIPHLVVDVGDVHDKVDIVSEVVHHNATNNIGGDVVARMSQVTDVVDGRPTGIPRDFPWLARNKRHRPAGLERIVNLDGGHYGRRMRKGS